MAETAQCRLLLSLSATALHSDFDALFPRGAQPVTIVTYRLLALLILPAFDLILHESVLRLHGFTNCRLTHSQLLHFRLTQSVRKIRNPAFKPFQFLDRLHGKLWDFNKVYFKIFCQPMPALNIVYPIHSMRFFLRQKRKVKQIDRNGTVQFLISLSLMNGLVHLCPVVERTLFHIAPVDELYFDVNAAAVTGDPIEIQTRQFILRKLRLHIAVNKRDILKLIRAFQPQYSI